MSQADSYVMGRQAAEAERLNRQNKMLITAVGYVLHPMIKRKLPSEPRIAEIGTGTGAFLADLSKELPPATILDGYDISDVSFLPASQRPENLTFSLADAKQPAPAELQGKYDAVCLRFMNVAMRGPADWAAVASHALQLLKPGGALQWIEGDFLSMLHPLQSTPETKTTALAKGASQSLGQMPHLNWFARNLADVLAVAGFELDVVQNVMSTDRVASAENRREMSYIAIGAVNSILRFQARSKAEGMPSEDEVESIVKEMAEEIENGAYCRCDLHQFIAFKKA